MQVTMARGTHYRQPHSKTELMGSERPPTPPTLCALCIACTLPFTSKYQSSTEHTAGHARQLDDYTLPGVPVTNNYSFAGIPPYPRFAVSLW